MLCVLRIFYEILFAIILCEFRAVPIVPQMRSISLEVELTVILSAKKIF